jgi:esterase/lipase superfamily enzyme
MPGTNIDFTLYERDRNSALTSRPHFIDLLKTMQTAMRTKDINLLAHSMGNFLTVDALANYMRGENTLNVSRLAMAAPDIDRDQFIEDIPALRNRTSGMTLYACSNDWALFASRMFARGARAGDIVDGKPVIVDGVEAIDITAIGTEIFGFNHGQFSTNRAVMDDIKLMLDGVEPPTERLTEIRSVPEGSSKPEYWRFAP